MLHQLLLLLHVIIALVLIGLILLQPGKGSAMGAIFGSSASQTLFGSQGADSFLLKLTSVLALLFFTTSLALGYLVNKQAKQDSSQPLVERAEKLPQPATPLTTEQGSVG